MFMLVIIKLFFLIIEFLNLVCFFELLSGLLWVIWIILLFIIVILVDELFVLEKWYFSDWLILFKILFEVGKLLLLFLILVLIWYLIFLLYLIEWLVCLKMVKNVL